MMRKLTSIAVLLAVAVLTDSASAEPKVTTVLKGLNNPCGVTIQPETGVIFVSDSGAGKVVKVVDGKAVDVITDFPIDVYGKGPKYNIGPLGLGFIDQKTLVVGGGGLADGEELLRIYELGDDAVKADKMASNFKLEATDDIKGEGNFYGIAITDKAIFVTCNGDDTKGWVSKADINGTKIGPYVRSIATKEAVEVDAPVGVTVSPSGHLVVGQMGEITVPGDSLLTYYKADSGEKLLSYETGLHDITALAYGPGETRQLYALDFAWNDTTKGGLFQIVRAEKDGKPAVRAINLLGLTKPTAMAFGKDGELYVTIIGESEDGTTGELLRIDLDGGKKDDAKKDDAKKDDAKKDDAKKDDAKKDDAKKDDAKKDDAKKDDAKKDDAKKDDAKKEAKKE